MDSADDSDPHIWYRLDDLLDILARYFVHGVNQFRHGLLCLLNLRKERLKRLPNVNELVLIWISALWHNDWRVFIVNGLPVVALQPFVGGDGFFAGIVVNTLPVP